MLLNESDITEKLALYDRCINMLRSSETLEHVRSTIRYFKNLHIFYVVSENEEKLFDEEVEIQSEIIISNNMKCLEE